MIQKAATVRVAIAVAVLAGGLTVPATSALAKKPEASAPQLTNASLTLDCRTGEAIHSYAWSDVSGRWVIHLMWLVDWDAPWA